MKVLLVGPYPPPHGGVSVHVRNAQAILSDAGVHCSVLNIKGRALLFLGRLVRYVFDDWTIHVHTNGHNPKSWLVAVVCGFAAQIGSGGVLTLHSGLLPSYLAQSPDWIRTTARLTCLLYHRVICVNDEIADALRALGVPSQQLKVAPAFLPAQAPRASIPDSIAKWITAHEPVITTTMSFQPEYGFELLISALQQFRDKRPRFGCVVMGGGEEKHAAEELIRHCGMGSQMLLTGDVPYDLCLHLMSCSDLFVRPTFMDGDSNSVREALALGTPVVASNVGTRPEGVVLFEPGDQQGLVKAIESGLRARRANIKREPLDYSRQLLSLYA